MSILKRFSEDERGATAIEYCMVGGMLSIMILIGCRAIGVNLTTLFLGPLAAGFPP